MTSLETTSTQVDTIDTDALILGVIENSEIAAHPLLPEEVRAALTAQAAPLEPSAKVGSTTVFVSDTVTARRVVLVGVGEGTDSELREAAGSASRACGDTPGHVVVALPALTDSAHTAVAEGATLGAYTFTDYRGDEEQHPGATWQVAGAPDAAIAAAKITVAGVAGVRDLVNTAPLDLYPESFAEIARHLTDSLDLEYEVWDPQRLAAEGFGGLLAVGVGSSRLPRLVRVGYSPKKFAAHVALVGKGITFDSGGLSLKPPAAMETMKSDMAGAATVLHVVAAAAQAELPIKVTAWLCLAENLPSGTAQRPSDVIRIYGGKSVEVLNTDAEGRLVLADGLVKAQEESPDVLIDVATLTGAQGVALGERTSGVMGDADIRDAVVAAADSAGEPMWAMPLPEYLRASLDSTIADIQNIGDRANAGMLTAGLFLKEFVDDTPWAHLDIARPSFNEKPAHGFTTRGGTGIAVRTLLQYLRNYAGGEAKN